MRRRIDDLTVEVSRLQGEVDATEGRCSAEMAEMGARLAEAQDEASDRSAQHARATALEAEVETLEGRLAQTTDENKNLVSLVVGTQARRRDTLSRSMAMEDELRIETDAEVARLHQELRRARMENDTLQRSVWSTEERITRDAYSNHVEPLRRQLADLQAAAAADTRSAQAVKDTPPPPMRRATREVGTPSSSSGAGGHGGGVGVRRTDMTDATAIAAAAAAMAECGSSSSSDPIRVAMLPSPPPTPTHEPQPQPQPAQVYPQQHGQGLESVPAPGPALAASPSPSSDKSSSSAAGHHDQRVSRESRKDPPRRRVADVSSRSMDRSTDMGSSVSANVSRSLLPPLSPVSSSAGRSRSSPVIGIGTRGAAVEGGVVSHSVASPARVHAQAQAHGGTMVPPVFVTEASDMRGVRTGTHGLTGHTGGGDDTGGGDTGTGEGGGGRDDTGVPDGSIELSPSVLVATLSTKHNHTNANAHTSAHDRDDGDDAIEKRDMDLDVSEVTGVDESLESAFTLEALLGADRGPKPGPLFDEGRGGEDGDGRATTTHATVRVTRAKNAGCSGAAAVEVDILADVGAGSESESRSVLEINRGKRRDQTETGAAGSGSHSPGVRERAEMDADWAAFRRALISPGPPVSPTPGTESRKRAGADIGVAHSSDRDRDDWRSALRHMEENGDPWSDVGLDDSDGGVSPGELDRSLSQTLARLVDVLDHQGQGQGQERERRRGDKDTGTEVMGTMSTMDESLSLSQSQFEEPSGRCGGTSTATDTATDSRADAASRAVNANTVVVESSHPYEAGVDSYRVVQLSSALAGAGAVLVSFDPLSQMADGDYVTIYRDDSHEVVWGAQRYHGGGHGRGKWAGVGREPALLVHATRFVVHLHSELGYSNGSGGGGSGGGDVDSCGSDGPSFDSHPRGWGYRLHIRPVAVSGGVTGAGTTAAAAATAVAAAEPETRAHTRAGALVHATSPLPSPGQRRTPKSTPRALRRARTSPTSASRVTYGSDPRGRTAESHSPGSGTPGTARARRTQLAAQSYGRTVGALGRSRGSGGGGGGGAQRVRRTIGGAVAVSPSRSRTPPPASHPSRDRGASAGARPGWTAQSMRTADTFSGGVRARRFAL